MSVWHWLVRLVARAESDLELLPSKGNISQTVAADEQISQRENRQHPKGTGKIQRKNRQQPMGKQATSKGKTGNMAMHTKREPSATLQSVTDTDMHTVFCQARHFIPEMLL